MAVARKLLARSFHILTEVQATSSQPAEKATVSGALAT